MSDNTVFTDSGIEVYEDNIYIALDRYIKERGIKDMSKETQGRWNAAYVHPKAGICQLTGSDE